jgi:hypothetical protein
VMETEAVPSPVGESRWVNAVVGEYLRLSALYNVAFECRDFERSRGPFQQRKVERWCLHARHTHNSLFAALYAETKQPRKPTLMPLVLLCWVVLFVDGFRFLARAVSVWFEGQ